MSSRSNGKPSLAIDSLLEFLATDNEWHTLDEIAQETALPAEEVSEIVEAFMTQIRAEEKLSAP
jgi:DNA-directed RNA polymerase sigma subunit (sigma70/sigma32)